MERKIFVSYKHSDHDVAALSGAGNNTTVRTYVDYIADILIGNSDHIYKGEHANEDLSGYSENYIRIYVEGNMEKRPTRVRVEGLYKDGALAHVVK